MLPRLREWDAHRVPFPCSPPGTGAPLPRRVVANAHSMCFQQPVGLNGVQKLRAEERGLRFSWITQLASAARAPGDNATHPYQAGVHTSL